MSIKFPHKTGQKGQSLLEAVLVIVVLVPFLLLVIHVFFWLVADYIVIYTAREAVKTASFTGDPIRVKNILAWNMRYLDRGFKPTDTYSFPGLDTVPKVELEITDNFGNTKATPAWTDDSATAQWFRDIDNPEKFGLRITVNYQLPNILMTAYLPGKLQRVKATSWAPFICTSNNYDTICK